MEISQKQISRKTNLAMYDFLKYLLLFLDDKVDNLQITKVQPFGFCLAFDLFFADFRLQALLIKVLLIKKRVI